MRGLGVLISLWRCLEPLDDFRADFLCNREQETEESAADIFQFIRIQFLRVLFRIAVLFPDILLCER